MSTKIQLAQQPEADDLLGRSPLAALVGMLLDQQIPMEWAFSGPYTIAVRMGRDDLDAREIAAYDPEAFAALLSEKPAVHRYPGSMATRVQQLCQFLVEHYDGDPGALWRDVATGAEVLTRLNALPGFGRQKSQIFLALLGKQFAVRPRGWREAAGAYGDEGSFRSAADITGPETLAKVRAFKQEAKRAAKQKAEKKTEKPEKQEKARKPEKPKKTKKGEKSGEKG
ncbi:HhH-GPD-type base excision DNA repair protein [Streptomyces sp. SID3212]|uniref:HhH-GPD-type base excision DNA repair protein n=1 Tax=unclassified Streptomyces TaxID=2593676 RepID=UPI001369C3AE|nr:HhH-GPD-type base excision DNA repair protein [Streptomyces sp. SID3212]MYV55960.1 Fe-S cluster assembly protein HesB [Streptomyces sp. SID3212]